MFPLACTVGQTSRGAVCFLFCLWFCFHILFVNASLGNNLACLSSEADYELSSVKPSLLLPECNFRKNYFIRASLLEVFPAAAKKIAINSEIHPAQRMAFTFLCAVLALCLLVQGFLIWWDFGSLSGAVCLFCSLSILAPDADFQQGTSVLVRAFCRTKCGVVILPKCPLLSSVLKASSSWAQLRGSMNALYTWIPSEGAFSE